MTYVLNMIHICPNIYILYPIVIFKIIYVIAMYKKLGITNIMKIARKNYFNISNLKNAPIIKMLNAKIFSIEL